MPTIHRFNSVRVVVYPNDHRPAHVHLVGDGAEAVISLNCPDGPVTLRENFGFSQQQLTVLKRQIELALTMFCEKWSEIHGPY